MMLLFLREGGSSIRKTANGTKKWASRKTVVLIPTGNRGKNKTHQNRQIPAGKVMRLIPLV